MDVEKLQRALDDFAEARNWSQFHNPKNLVMALSVECAELVEEFQWLTPEQAENVMAEAGQAMRVREEMADITLYLLRLADRLGVDLEATCHDKMAGNAARYPVDAFYGSARKYNR